MVESPWEIGISSFTNSCFVAQSQKCYFPTNIINATMLKEMYTQFNQGQHPQQGPHDNNVFGLDVFTIAISDSS